jgi:hypothetical protein
MLSKEEVIPTPHYFEPQTHDIELIGSIRIHVEAKDPKVLLAARLLKDGIEAQAPALRGSVRMGGDKAEINLHLVQWPGNFAFESRLNVLDRQVLNGECREQAYVLRTFDNENVLIAGGAQGILYGAVTLLNLLRQKDGVPAIPGVYIRDYPDFEYRVSSGWLLNGEANRWSLDRGQGIAAYEALVKRKLDRCLKYKINTVMFDGFGCKLDTRGPEYPGLMRRLNAYARERGIHLIFGTYGAGYGMSYQKGPLYEDASYQGTTFINRESYPDGAVYSCMGYNEDKVRKGVNAAELGTCRSNEELNRLKAKELQEFVRAVEPGSIYIHNEDFGGFDTTQKFWLRRCPRCRERWPNDDAAAIDGGAGGVANCLAKLIEAINAVKNPESGFDAARDTKICIASPVYSPSSPSSEDWHKAITHWTNIVRSLPKMSNLQVAFRETFPQTHGPVRWVDAFNRAMKDVGLDVGVWMYFLSGGDNWCSDVPFVATPCMNSIFQGAQAVYSANGSGYQEAQQLLNAECAWNTHSGTALLGAKIAEESHKLWFEMIQGNVELDSVFGDSGFLHRACVSLYGESSAPGMVKYYREHVELTEIEQKADAAGETDNTKVLEPKKGNVEFVPMAFKKIFGIPVHWRRLALDAKSWGEEIKNERYLKHLADIGIQRAELHNRLKRYWETIGAQSQKACAQLRGALASSPKADSREDLEFFLKSAEVSISLSGALSRFHEGLRQIHRNEAEGVKAILEDALNRTKGVGALAKKEFPDVTDVNGAEVGCLRKGVGQLEGAIQEWIGSLAETQRSQRRDLVEKR